jgi:cysteine dioxygenase
MSTEIPHATNLKTLMEILEIEFTQNKTIEGNVARLTKIFESYRSNAQDWKDYALFDPSSFTRNLVDDGNGRFNLIIQCWGPGQSSPVQDHAKGHSIFKTLHGDLTETIFDVPNISTEQPLLEKKSMIYSVNQVSYINNKMGLQQICNKSASPSVSIHLYSPPINECQFYSPKSGRAKSSGKLSLYSKYGELTHPSKLRYSIGHAFNISAEYYRAAQPNVAIQGKGIGHSSTMKAIGSYYL